MIRTTVIDDEKRTARGLCQLLAQVAPDVKILSVEHSIQSGLDAIQKDQPQLVFLDIKMPKGTGFDLLDRLTSIDFDLIFTTAYDHYAIRAIKFSALDYLLKPIDMEELEKAVQKVRQRQETQNQKANIDFLLKSLESSLPSTPFEKIALPSLKGYSFVAVKDIIYCEAEGTYSKVYLTRQKQLLVSRNLKEIESLLAEHTFFRIHRSYLVNMDHLLEYARGEGGQVQLSNGAILPVSQRRKELFVRYINGMS
ncbi:MAG: LytTR family DNA-binding domain-containing protein [Bacteroidota bacterium]